MINFFNLKYCILNFLFRGRSSVILTSYSSTLLSSHKHIFMFIIIPKYNRLQSFQTRKWIYSKYSTGQLNIQLKAFCFFPFVQLWIPRKKLVASISCFYLLLHIGPCAENFRNRALLPFRIPTYQLFSPFGSSKIHPCVGVE